MQLLGLSIGPSNPGNPSPPSYQMDLGRSQVAFGGWSEVLRGSQEFTSVIAFKPNPHNKGWKQDGTPTLETILPTQNCRATAKEGNLFLEMPVAGTH